MDAEQIMQLAELIDLAVEAKGSRAEVAKGLHQSAQRLTDWKAGRRKPDAHEIAYLAECAGLPVLQTVAEIEAQLDERYAPIWREALGKLTAAGVAASMMMTVAIGPDRANAAPSPSQATKGSLYIMSTRLRRLLRFLGLRPGRDIATIGTC
jgi:transcriptional regulator with XRE-family HTH domain